MGGNHYVAGVVWNADVEEALMDEIAKRCATTSKGVAVVIIGHSLGGEKAIKMADWFDSKIKSKCATKTRHISVVSIDAVKCSGWFCTQWVEYKTAPTAATVTFQNHYQTEKTPHGAKITGATNTIYDFDANFTAYVGTGTPHVLIDDYLADKTVLIHSTTTTKQKLAGWVKLEADTLVTKAK